MTQTVIFIRKEHVLTFIKLQHDGCHKWSRNCLSFLSTWVHPRFVLLLLIFTVLCSALSLFYWSCIVYASSIYGFWAGADPGGGAHPARAPLKLEKNMIFLRKIMIFHTRYPKFFAPPSARCNFFKRAPPNLKSWIHPCWVPLWYLQHFLSI